MAWIRYSEGEKAGKENYGNFSTGERVSLGKDGLLHGDAAMVYSKANPALILAAGPLIRRIYAAFLPFNGITIIMKLSFATLFGRCAEGLSRRAIFNGRPTEAYLAGRRHTKKKTGEYGPPKEKKMSGKEKE